MGQPIDTATVLLVSDASGFARQVKTQVDEALRGIASEVNRAFSAIERQSQAAGAEIGTDFQRGGEVAESAFREVSRTARKEFAEVDVAASSSAAGISTKLGGALAFVKTAMLGLTVGIAAGLAGMTAFGLKSAAGLEQTQVAFDSLLGSTEEGKKVFDSLKEFANVTPFELGDITPLAQKFLAFSGNVGLSKDQLQQFLTTAGNIVSVTGGGAQALDSIGLAFSHISSGGKVSLEDINILSDALPGFSGVAAIAAAKGISTGEAMTQISAGAIDAQTGVAALLAGMNSFPGAAGAMEKRSQTLLGVFSTFKDTLGQALAGGFQPVIPEIKASLGELTPVLGSAIGELAPSLGKALSAILPILGKLITALVPVISPILDALGPVLDAIGPALIPLGEALGQLIVALAPVLPVLAQFIAVLAELAVPVIKLLAAVLTPLTPVLNFMALAIGEVAKALGMIDWTAVGSAIGGAFSDAWHAVADFFGKVIQGWLLFHDFVLGKIEEFKANVIAGFNLVVQFVQDLPGNLLRAAGNFINTLAQSGRDLVTGLWNGISGAAGWLWGKITSFVNDNVTGPIKAALGIHSPSTVMRDEVGAMLPAGIAEGVQGGIPSLASLIGSIVPSASAASTGTTFAGGINVTINFVGGTPTAAEARTVGQAAGDGIMQAIARRNVATAVRMGVSG